MNYVKMAVIAIAVVIFIDSLAGGIGIKTNIQDWVVQLLLSLAIFALAR